MICLEADSRGINDATISRQINSKRRCSSFPLLGSESFMYLPRNFRKSPSSITSWSTLAL